MTDIVNYILDLGHQWWLMGLFLLSLLENLIPPIPSEVIMPWWWYLAAAGKIFIWSYLPTKYLALFIAIFFATLGSTIWSVPYYFLGRLIKKDTITKFVYKYGKYMFMSTNDVDYIYEIYQKNWWKLTFFGRFLPLGRGFVGLPAGSTGMAFWRFFGYTFAWSFIRVSILSCIWFALGDKYITEWWSTIKIIEYVIIAIVIIWLFSRWLHILSKKYFK